MTAIPTTAPGPGPRATVRPAADLLHEARARERAACIPEAIAGYQAAIAAAEGGGRGEQAVLAEALRRLAVVRHRCNQSAEARELCGRSQSAAREAGNDLLAAEALNTLGGIELEAGALPEARKHFLRAVQLGGPSRELRARVEQNLGILASIQGDFDEALACYQRSLEAYTSCNDEHGCAIAYHNLGMASVDRGEFDHAEQSFRQSSEIAERAGDAHLQGMCLVNHAVVHIARERYEEARRNAEAALAIFDQLGARSDKAEAYRVIGMVYRDTGRPALAESR
ncbi:MAG: tetratricopeptide repeat protein, partial [Gemmatimonadales bacterium]